MVEQELNMTQWREAFLQAIENATKKQKWLEHAKNAMGVFRSERDDELPVYHNNLANAVQVQQGAVMTQAPEIVCNGNNELTYDDDILAQATEKILKHYTEEHDLSGEGDKFTTSVFAASNGAIRVNDDLTFTTVNHENMVVEPAQDWYQVDWIAFKHYITRGVYVDKFGEPNVEGYEKTKVMKVWEVWDKKNGKVWWISQASEETLECEAPTVNFKNFYPIPKPVYLDCQTCVFEPVVEYRRWQHLDEQIQKIAGREKHLLDAIKAGYFYDQAVFEDLSSLEFTEDAMGHPADGSQYSNGGSFNVNNSISYYDNSQYIQTLDTLTMQREQLQQKVNQTVGLSNEMQSISTPNETATSQRIKQGWGSSRLEVKRRLIHCHMRDVIRLLAEAIVQVEDIDTLTAIAGENMADVIGTNIDQGLIAYEIDIETQTSIAINEKEERADKLEFLNTFAGVASQFAPLVDSGKMDMATLTELMKMVTSSFPSSRNIDDNIDKLPELFNAVQQANGQIQQMSQQAQQMQQTLAQFEMENKALKQQLKNSTQVDMRKKLAETEKIMADKDKTISEIVKTDVETVQTAAGATVPPDAVVDESIAINWQ